MNELLEVFSSIKKAIYKIEFKRYNMDDILNKDYSLLSDEDLKFINEAYLYLTGMKNSLESLGTKIIEIERFSNSIPRNKKFTIIQQSQFEEIIKGTFIIIDKYIDGLSAFSKIYQIKGSEFDFIKKIMELRAKRDLLWKYGNLYLSKLIKGVSDGNELQFFLNDFLDSLINEAYKIQLVKLLKLFKQILKQQQPVVEEIR